MGKLLHFPVARARRARHSTAGLFAAYGELALFERAQLKLLASCGAGALLLTAALQLASR